jgi:S1-C subfamily serine protease
MKITIIPAWRRAAASCVTAVLCAVVLAACLTQARSVAPYSASNPVASQPRGLQKLARTAVFEVVVKKPPEDTAIVYEIPVDFSVLPYSARTDAYAPVGTAFAVSSTEAVTAFHVLNLASKSAVYDTFYLRQRGNDGDDAIYEIETITGASNEMDFVFFTVKDAAFSAYFEIERAYNTGDVVYSIGNAWGEGIVTRNGEILGTAPEEVGGRWQNIKTSAQGDPGNSGGPLVNRAGKVIGIVSYIRDTLVYSVPFQAIDRFPENQLSYSLTLDYGHLVLANRVRRTFDVTLPLPQSRSEVQRQITARYHAEYENAMRQLFAEAPAYLYGDKNTFLLDSSPDSLFPQIDFVDANDGEWKLAGFEVARYRVDQYQTLLTAEAGSFEIWRITDNGPVQSLPLQPDPEAIVEYALKKVRVERTLAGSRANETYRFRILSLGSPYEQSEYRDSLGRLWIEARFLLPFDDKVFIVFLLPTPSGYVLLTAFCPSAAAGVFAYDMKKTLDHTHIAYSATFERWDEFLRIAKWVPAFLKDVFVRWESAESTLTLQTPPLTARLNAGIFEWSARSELFLSPAWQRDEGGITYGLQKLVFDKGDGTADYAVVYRNNKPAHNWGFGAERLWQTILARGSPFDEIPTVTLNAEKVAIGAVLQAEFPREDVRWTVYMESGRPGLQTEAQIRLNALKAGIRVK